MSISSPARVLPPNNLNIGTHSCAGGREVVVSRKAGEAVLRGAPVFIPGVLSASATIVAGDRLYPCAESVFDAHTADALADCNPCTYARANTGCTRLRCYSQPLEKQCCAACIAVKAVTSGDAIPILSSAAR